MNALLLIILLLIAPASYAATVGGGAGGGSGVAGDVGSINATTATNPSTETQLKELTLTAAALNTANKKLMVHASGRYTTAAAQTPTLRFRTYLCTVSGCGSGTVITLQDFTTAATTASTTNSWKIEGSIGTVTAGATGSVESKFWQQVQLGSAGDLTPETRLDQNNAASASIDLTGVLYVRTTVLMSSSNAGNSVTQRTGWVDGGAGLGGGGGGTPAGASGAVQTSNGAGAFLDSGVTASGGVLTGSLTGNASTATALAANGANCAAGQAPLGVTAAGAAETCTDYMEEPASDGMVARTAANTSAARTIAGTANQISMANGNGVSGNPTVSLATTLVIPGPSIAFTETAGDDTCGAGDYWIKANSTTTNFRKCQNGTATDLDTGGGGSIGGSTGATDNAVLRADGTGGATAQASGCTISDANLMTCPGGFAASGGGVGVLVLPEGTAPGAGTNPGEHNLYFDSGDSKLKSHENGGSVQTYPRASDNLSVFAATTSAELAGVLSDELGSSGGFTRGTSATHTTPTINTPTFGGSAPTFADGVTWTFNPNGTNAGINVGTLAGDPSAPGNADLWYDTGTGKLRTREGGVSKDVIPAGAGTGDLTSIVAGAGISCTTCGGADPTVTWEPNTYVSDVSLWNAANASRTLTANLSGATDPVITFSNAAVNVSTGALQVAGVAVSTADSTTTFTNKTYDAEGTGNTLTIARRIWLPAAGCNNATAGSIWDLPTSAPAVAACVTGTNTQKGVLDFADAADLSAQITWKLPSTWTGAVDANIKWFSATTTGDVVWQIQTICVADAETDDPAFNTASTVTDTAKGTTNQTNDAAISGVTVTGCAAGELMHIKIRRDAGHASDNHAATARLIGVELVVREAI